MDAASGIAQAFADFCQGYDQITFIFDVAPSFHIALRFQPLDDRRDRARVLMQSFGDGLDAEVLLIPQHQQHQVLRIGDAEFLQQRLVALRHAERCGVERKAQVGIDWRVFIAVHDVGRVARKVIVLIF